LPHQRGTNEKEYGSFIGNDEPKVSGTKKLHDNEDISVGLTNGQPRRTFGTVEHPRSVNGRQ
jgi:hypothetical protein